jgi:hypothetical protein
MTGAPRAAPSDRRLRTRDRIRMRGEEVPMALDPCRLRRGSNQRRRSQTLFLMARCP